MTEESKAQPRDAAYESKAAGAGDPLEAPVDHPLLGKRVRVVMARAGAPVGGWDHNPDRTDGPRLAADVYIVGTLVRLDAGGGFDIRRAVDGTMRYCWPALEITEEP